MKKTKNFKFLGLALLLSMVLPSQIFAAELPAVVVIFASIVTSIVTQVIVGLVVLIMLVIAAWEMKENGNARPLKWAIFASIVMGGAVFFGPSMIDFMALQLANVSGSGSSITSS